MSTREGKSKSKVETLQPVKTFFMLRRLVWTIGILLLVSLPLLSCIDHVCVQASYSAYYHVNSWTRNVFVGLLFAAGACLLAYKGFDPVEDRLLNIAGGSAALIALCPTQMEGAPSNLLAYMHNVVAVVFFACIAVVAIRPQRHLLDLLPKSEKLFEKRQFFIESYRWAARFMLIGPVAAVVLTFLFGRESFVVWVAEAIAILAFSYYWRIKNKELALSRADEKVVEHKLSQPTFKGVLPEIQGISSEIFARPRKGASAQLGT